jgi:hypothetical protein
VRRTIAGGKLGRRRKRLIQNCDDDEWRREEKIVVSKNRGKMRRDELAGKNTRKRGGRSFMPIQSD